jgi:hypothetical protein
VFAQYDQKPFDGFNRELLQLAEKWRFQTKTTVFLVTQHSKVENEVKTEHKAKRLNTIKGKPFELSDSIKKLIHKYTN